MMILRANTAVLFGVGLGENIEFDQVSHFSNQTIKPILNFEGFN